MLRFVLLPILYILIARAVWRLVGGIVEGITGRRRPGVPDSGVHMVRDPVCGTYVVPGRAVAISDGRAQVFFCSTTCRDNYRARAT